MRAETIMPMADLGRKRPKQPVQQLIPLYRALQNYRERESQGSLVLSSARREVSYSETRFFSACSGRTSEI